MKKIELLAPAGSMESLYAAVQAGADAVYLGGNKFSARAYASNFDNENMTKALEYCHLYNVKMYVTINTILKEDEVKEALEYAKFLYKIGVDALIIQDLGFANLIRKNLPNFELHASTQMTIHNAEGALFLRELGFKRIVLSRELSLKEISHISRELGVETEIFVHGALCVCYSGQCLMSSMIGGRSGNRGRCAQSCRLPNTIIDKRTMTERKGYLLSPKDICTIEDVKDIVESGTSSLKIEGRMKRPEYVVGVVQAYRRAIDNALGIERKSMEEINFKVEKEKKKLLQLFNREGFSKAYLYGNVGRDMMAYTFPKNTGVELGKVQKDLTVVLKENISIKDGIRTEEEGFTVSKIIKNGKEVEDAFKGDKVKLMPLQYKSGSILYKTSDVKLLNELEEVYKKPFERKVQLNLSVRFRVEEPIELSCCYEGESLKVTGEVVQKALKKPLDKKRVIDSLSKAGDTPFKFTDISFQEFDNGFLPISALNEVRRSLVEKLSKHILDKNSSNMDYSYEKQTIKNDIVSSKSLNEDNLNKAVEINSYSLPETIVYVSNEEQLRAFIESDFRFVAVNPFSLLDFSSLDKLKERKVFIKIPNIIRTEFEHLIKQVQENLDRVEGVITANLGAISRLRGKTNIIGDYKLNIFNSEALDFYKDFLIGSCLSVELNKKETRSLVKKAKLPTQTLVYGKIELMVSEYCPIGSTFGGKCSTNSCNNACKRGEFVLKDRKGEEFVLGTDRFCRSYIYNNVPINLIDNIGELRDMNINSFRVDFIDESYERTKKILETLKNEEWKDDFSQFTRGHYKRGVE
ncbi:U32 family peptidase [Clostridium sp. A1-XYC3]|uniref:U32 family peptidase n=1 Tax=Clostridium tanneri TaxID=3037988 RepID=A0ABU4JT53_9CLOT|nr:U32 family peptidase [Clostridium sp. A1-XYC3]MDW8801303.1 U32 family peptidase [Clostridium sp. A1-XYC3]